MDTKQHTCDPCALDAAIQDASSFCVVCVERLCDDCVKFHGKNKATRTHKILTDDDVPIDTDTFRLLAESAFCKTHPEREIQFKCEDHDEFMCGICARKAHRHCEHMVEIDSELDETKAREECQLTINGSRDLYDKLSIAKIDTEIIIEKCLYGKEQVIEERKIIFQSMHDLITNFETNTYTEIDILYNNHIEILRSDIEKITAKEQQQIKDQGLLDVTLKYGDTKTMEIITNRTARQLKITQGTLSDHANKPIQASTTNKAKFLETIIKNLEEKIKNDLPENETSTDDLLEEKVFNKTVVHGSDEYASFMLEVDDIIHTSKSLVGIKETSLQECQDQRDTNQKGTKALPKTREKVKDTPSLKDQKDTNQKGIKALPKTREKVKDTPSLKKPKSKQKMSLIERKLGLANVHNYDVSWSPSGCVLLQDGRLVTIGSTIRGHVISVFNTSMKVIFESVLYYDPYEICSLGEREVAITYSDYKRIDKFLILEDNIEKHGGFPTKLYGRGITKHGNDIAVLFVDEGGDTEVTSKNNKVEIQIRRNDGKLTDTIDKYQDMNFKELSIKSPSCILSLPDEDILVGDKTHLRCFDVMYKQCKWHLGSYKEHVLKQVKGITTDKEGNILVCGKGSNNVHQLCANNYRQNRVLIPEINDPICIAYDDKSEKIIVGCGDNTIRVFKFV